MTLPPACEQVRALLDAGLDTSLTTEDAAVRDHHLREHLGHCLGCQGEMRALRGLLDRARALPQERSPDRDLWPDVVARIRQRRQVRVRAGTFAAAAGVALLMGALGAGMGRPLDDGAQVRGGGMVPSLAEVASGGMGGGGVGGAGGVAAGSGGGAGQPRGRPMRSTWR